MPSTLAQHHRVWLEGHPERTEDWLRERLREGFDVHHVDGCAQNNSGANLVLIEARDHLRLHGKNIQRVLMDRADKITRARAERDRAAYEAKTRELSWPQVGDLIFGKGRDPTGNKTIPRARRYAKAFGLPWPKPNVRKPKPPSFEARRRSGEIQETRSVNGIPIVRPNREMVARFKEVCAEVGCKVHTSRLGGPLRKSVHLTFRSDAWDLVCQAAALCGVICLEGHALSEGKRYPIRDETMVAAYFSADENVDFLPSGEGDYPGGALGIPPQE